MATNLADYEPVTKGTGGDFEPATKTGSLDDYEPYTPRSAIGEIATGAKRGLYQGIAGAGSVLQAPAEGMGQKPGVVSRIGKALEDYGTQKSQGEDLAAQPEDHNAVTNFLAGQVAPAPGSMLPMLAASGAGAAIGSAAGPVGTIVGGGIGAGSEAALQSYHEKYQEALKAGKSEDEARSVAGKSAALQGGIMAGVGMVPGMGPLAGGGAKTAAEAATAAVTKKFVPEAAKGAAQLTVANVGAGAASAAGQAAIDKAAGIGKGETPEGAAAGSLGPSLGATLGFLPMAFLHARGNVLAAAKNGRALADPTVAAKERQAAVDAVAANIGKYDETGAQNWAANAAQGIREGKPIGIGPDWMTGPHPDLFADSPTLKLTGPMTVEEAAAAANARRAARQKAAGFEPQTTDEQARTDARAGMAEPGAGSAATAAQVAADRHAEEVRRGGLDPKVQMDTWGEVLDKDGNPLQASQPSQGPNSGLIPAESGENAVIGAKSDQSDQSPNATKTVAVDPLHAPDAGPLTRAAAQAVDSGVAADPYKAPIDEAHPVRPNVTQPPDLQMQNRDRSRPGSIAQMNAIAQNPDYDRLGVGTAPGGAAPMVSVAANHPTIPEEDFGKSSVVVMGDNSKIATRYAVVEAPDVLASHNVDGSVNGDYFAAVPPGTIRTLTNGRVAALQEAYKRGTAEPYKAAMIADAAAHGVSAEAIESKKNPILVRVYDDKENERPNIGALSNTDSTMKLSMPEQAQNDARTLDAGNLTVDESGSVMNAKNEGVFKQFLQALPDSERGALVTKSGYTKQFVDRVRGALFAKAYGNMDLVNMATEEHDPDIKNVLAALTAAAPEFAKVEHGGALDIRPSLIEATHLIREAKARGMKPADMLAQQDMLGRDPMTQTIAGFMAANARSPKKMTEAFSSMARFQQNEREASKSVDMFNKGPATMVDLARSVNTHLEREYGPETQLRVAEKSAAYAAGAKERAAQSGSGARAAPTAHVGKLDRQQGAGPGPAAEPVHDYANYLKGDNAQTLAPLQRRVLLKQVSQASQDLPAFEKSLKKIVADIPGAVLTQDRADIKKPTRAVAKIAAEYEGNPKRIKDLLRATIEVKSLADVAPAINAIRAEFGPVPSAGKFRNTLDPKATTSAEGYRDVLYNVGVGERIYEVQVNVAEMSAVKKRTHVHKQARDVIERRAYREKRDLTPAEVAKVDELNATMRAAYEPVFASLVANAKKAISEIGGSRETASIGNRRPGVPGTQAVAPDRAGLTETATPSQSKNVVPAGKESGKKAGFTSAIVPEKPVSSKVDAPAITALSKLRNNMAAFAEQRQVVPLSDLVSSKDERQDAKFLAGALDSRVRAASYMVDAIAGKRAPRPPITVRKLPDGKYQVLDGNATVQAARLAGWTKLPIDVQPGPVHEGAKDALATIRRHQEEQLRAKLAAVKDEFKRNDLVLAEWTGRDKAVQQVVMTRSVATEEDRRRQGVGGKAGDEPVRVTSFEDGVPTGHREYDSIEEAAGEFAFVTAKIVPDFGKQLRVAEHGFQLKGETFTESKIAAMLRARNAAANAKKEAAPAPESFSLTGSDRVRDLNPAQRDIFDAADKFVQKSLDALPLDPVQNNAKARTARESAVRALTQAGRLNVLAASLNLDMIKEGKVSLLGQKVTSLADLAAVAQVARNPLFETLRYLAVKDGHVVHETVVSSRLPAASAAFVGDWKDFANGLRRAIAGTDGFYMLHNHPSGDPSPSHPDLTLTQRLAEQFPSKMLGHVVIDHDKYAIITIDERGAPIGRVIEAKFGGAKPQTLETPAVRAAPGSAAEATLGAPVNGSSQVFNIGRNLSKRDHVAMIGVGIDGRVVAIAEMPLSQVTTGMRTKGTINRFAKSSGAGAGVFLANVPDSHQAIAKELVINGFLRDAVTDTASSVRAALPIGQNLKPFVYLGRDEPPARAQRSSYRPGDLFGDAAQVNEALQKRIATEAPALAALPKEAPKAAEPAPGPAREEPPGYDNATPEPPGGPPPNARGHRERAGEPRPPTEPSPQRQESAFSYTMYQGVAEQPRGHLRGAILDAFKRLFLPSSRGGFAKLQAGLMRANLGRMARDAEVANTSFQRYAKAFSKLSQVEQVGFINRYERGEAQPSAALREAAEAMSAFNRELRQELQALGKLDEFNENYLGRIWLDPEAKVNSVFARRPLEGSKNFLKRRVYDYFSQGLMAGLKPITYNPVEMMLLKGVEQRRFIYAQKIMAEMRSAGLIREVPYDAHGPDGWTALNDKLGRNPRGRLFAPDEAAVLFNNHLSPGLRGNAAYDMFHKAGMMLNSAQLGLSLFHAGFTTIDSMVSKAALGIQQLSRGQMLAGFGNVLQSLNPVQPFLNFYKGDRLLRAYLGKLNDPSLAPIVQALVQGGGRARMDEFYRNATLNAFKQALERNDKLGVARHLLPSILDRINAPIFEQLVPRQKLGIFFDMAKDWIERNPNASLEAKREAMGKFWDSVDNRMGQLAYDNVFWNRTLKDMLMVSVRSVGWNLGTFRELGGGALDVRHILRDKELSSRTAYLVALPFLTGLMGSMIGYMYTGKGPDELKDYFFPKTGRKRPDNSDDRLSLPSYMKDVYEYGHDISGFLKYGANPTQTLQNKMHPLISTVAQMLNNQDFFGGAIRSPGDPAMVQLADEAKYLGNQLSPFGVRNYLQQSKVRKEEPSVAGYLTSPPMIGVTPAPGYITKSDQQTEAAALGKMKDALITKFREELQAGAAVSDVSKRAFAAGLRLNEVHMLVRQGLAETQVSRLPPRRLMPAT